MIGMNGGSRIIDLRTGNAPAADDDLLLTEELPAPTPAPTEAPMVQEYEQEEVVAPSRSGLVMPIIGALVSLGWVGGMLWLARASLATLGPVALAEFVAALCVPPALIAVRRILAMRTSRAEARRFGDVSRAMRAEAASRERTVAALSQTIEANRQHIAEQTTALMAMGDGAISKLSAIGTGMSEQVGVANEHATRMSEAASGAHSSLSVLLAILPRAHGETVDMAKQLDAAGVSATERAAALGAELSALAERGREAEEIAGGAAQKLAAHLARMEATSETAGDFLG